MQAINYWKRSSGKLLLVGLTLVLLNGCAALKPEREIVTVTKMVAVDIPLAQKPKPVSLIKGEFYVVNEENYAEFLENFKKKNGQVVYIAMSVKDYENLSINMGELRRYINQQKEVIVYYETAIKESKDNINNSSN